MLPENDDLSTRRTLRRAGLIGVCVLGAIVALGSLTRLVQASNVKSWTADAGIPTVALVSPASGAGGQALTLPGTLQAYYDAQIFARVPGYVKAWNKDIGAQVHKGDVLAVIDTPELDQQIAQARADLGAAISARKLSGTTAQRWNSLLPLDAVSKQDVEEKDQDLAGKAGAQKAAQANLNRLLAMKGFARLTAPFDGIVTKRTTDIGALVAAGTASSGEPLFAVADVRRLRVYVNVPQSLSALIVPGMTASLTVPEYAGRSFAAKLVSTSGAISDRSSTLLVEFDVDNGDGILKPGDFAQVSLGLVKGGAALRLPASAMMFRAAGLQVATLGPGQRVRMKNVAIATDLGNEVVIGSGLKPSDRVINNPPDSLAEGDKVRIGSDAAD